MSRDRMPPALRGHVTTEGSSSMSSYTQQDLERDQALVSASNCDRGRAVADGRGFTWRPSAEAKAAEERLSLYRIDRAAENARAVLDRNWGHAPVAQANQDSSDAAHGEVVRLLAAVMLDNARAKAAKAAKAVLRHGHRRRARAEAEDAKPAPAYSCVRCNNAINPDDKIYCPPCAGAGDETKREPVEGARECSGCGEEVGAHVYCARCADEDDGGDDDDEGSQARAERGPARVRHRAGLTLGASARTDNGSAVRTRGRELSRHRVSDSRAMVAKFACPECSAGRGVPCRDEGRLIGHGACLFRERAANNVAVRKPQRDPDEAYYAGYEVSRR